MVSPGGKITVLEQWLLHKLMGPQEPDTRTESISKTEFGNRVAPVKGEG